MNGEPDHTDIMQAATLRGDSLMFGKGGGWIRGEGFRTLAQLRTRYGVPTPRRERRERVPAWGDFATVAMLNRIKS